MKRIFLGSFIHSPEIFDFFQEIKKTFTPDVFKAKWTVVPENLHITYHFFGAMPDVEIKHLQQVLQKMMSEEYQANIDLSRLSFFKRKNKPTILYIDIADSEGLLIEIHRNIQNILYEEGFITQKQDYFIPHITLARIKQVTPAFYDKLSTVNIQYNLPLKIRIIESIINPGGAIYKELKI